MATTPITPFRLSDEDLAILDAISRHNGTPSRCDAVRIAIRFYARAEGLRIPRAPTAKASAASTRSGSPTKPRSK